MNSILTKIGKLLGLLAVAILATYFAPEFVASAFYIAILIAYFQSKDEPFWFVFFLVISDGFIGVFNNYDAVLSAIPGLPPVEVGQFYIILTLVKTFKKKNTPKPFFDNFLLVCLIYLVFLVLQGYVLGVSHELNVQFRILKLILPLVLFYSIPRLFDEEDQFKQVFALLIPFAFFALFSQVFTINTGMAPSQMLGIFQKTLLTINLDKGHTYRGFYSTTIVLLSFFGSLFYIATDTKYFNKNLLYIVVAADFLSVFLSATRGWVLAFVLGLFLFLVFALKLSVRRIGIITITAFLIIMGLMSLPTVKKQFTNAYERVLTLESLLGGDVTAGGTLQRLNDRSPRVMHKWAESPLTGWGFSDEYFDFADFHVGNQNVLLHSGLIGAILLGLFFGIFHLKLILRSFSLPAGHPHKYALLVFPIFFLGWFIIHSTSGQKFHFYGAPIEAISQAFYFSFGALLFRITSDKNRSPE